MNNRFFPQTPPMGWNSYDYYNTTVTEEQIKANADYMAANLKEYGWEYIVIDIQWYAKEVGTMNDKFQYIPFTPVNMDKYSRLLPDTTRFPSSANGAGFAPLADYIHKLGLKFGIHIMRGIPRAAAHEHMAVLNSDLTADMVADPSSICGWNPDMYGVRNSKEGQAYYDSLIDLYASWGVDFIKCDDICNTNMYNNRYSAKHEIEMLSSAISSCGRPIVLSLSPGPALIDKAWHYSKYANMWRITDDFWDNWDLLKDMFTRCELWQSHVSPGSYPDCDMLPLGTIGKGFDRERVTYFTKAEQRTMMSLWCLFGSPLMLGGEMTLLDDFTLSLLTNKYVLAMLTPDCVPSQFSLDKEKAIWTASNSLTGDTYVALFNLSDDALSFTVLLEDLGIKTPEDTSSVMELWGNIESTTITENICTNIPAHDCRIYKF
ncbi:glycoside hydrolase family 27 protein [Lachnospiraceae bacterium OttesenSCG-928-D06]|nr:glycoside hydrolase family 27 protein [Lachnospiraceae bacterium OttesenSCG-928-D06]